MIGCARNAVCNAMSFVYVEQRGSRKSNDRGVGQKEEAITQTLDMTFEHRAFLPNTKIIHSDRGSIFRNINIGL